MQLFKFEPRSSAFNLTNFFVLAATDTEALENFQKYLDSHPDVTGSGHLWYEEWRMAIAGKVGDGIYTT